MTGWAGMILVLLAYWLLATDRLRPRATYHSLTGFGSFLLIIHNWGNWPMVLLSCAFVYASASWLLRKRGAMF